MKYMTQMTAGITHLLLSVDTAGIRSESKKFLALKSKTTRLHSAWIAETINDRLLFLR